MCVAPTPSNLDASDHFSRCLTDTAQVRLFSVLASHFVTYRSRRITVTKFSAVALFEPVITQTSSPLLECDFNIHKSNATFLTDLDINRVHLLATLFKTVVDPSLRPGPTPSGALGGLTAALGGVSCSFRREIKPYESYEIWSRVLSWDDKWLYIISHFVRSGAVKPTTYRLKSSSKPSRGTSKSSSSTAALNGNEKDTHMFTCTEELSKKVVFASAISKYVFKQGRRSIMPKVVLQELDLLPAETGLSGNAHEWDAARVELERAKGMELAGLFASLDGLHGRFSGGSAAALGRFGPFPW
jgi:hypothetical protein